MSYAKKLLFTCKIDLELLKQKILKTKGMPKILNSYAAKQQRQCCGKKISVLDPVQAPGRQARVRGLSLHRHHQGLPDQAPEREAPRPKGGLRGRGLQLPGRLAPVTQAPSGSSQRSNFISLQKVPIQKRKKNQKRLFREQLRKLF